MIPHTIKAGPLECSVVVCTHNPNLDRLFRVLSSLRTQTLPDRNWELILVDNASSWDVRSAVASEMPENGRCIRESKLGLTPARAAGIRAAAGDLIVFVDDDNVLRSDYLESAVRIAKSHPSIGAFCGSIKAEFEVQPALEIEPYLAGLAILEVERDYWSNLMDLSKATPVGAGLCVRAAVAAYYIRVLRSSTLRQLLDRCGQRLSGGGDTDLAYCAVDLGMGTGRFAALQLIHIIPKERLTESYLVRLHAGIAGSTELLRAVRPEIGVARRSWILEQIGLVLGLFRSDRLGRRILFAARRERQTARRLIERSTKGCKNSPNKTEVEDELCLGD